jgi:hypothetical protein
MKAIIIFYRGNDVSQSVVESLANMLALSGVEPIHCSARDDEAVSDAIIQSSLAKISPKGKLASLLAEEVIEPSDQEAIDNAAVYITEKVLKHFTTQTMITMAITNCILGGDREMRTAVEILATKKGVIKEPKLTKPVLNVIKSIYAGLGQIS